MADIMQPQLPSWFTGQSAVPASIDQSAMMGMAQTPGTESFGPVSELPSASEGMGPISSPSTMSAVPSSVVDNGIMGEFGKGISAGILRVKQTVPVVKALVGNLFGSQSMEQQGISEMTAIENELKQYSAAVPSYENVKDISSAAKYATYGVASNLPNMLISLASGGIGALTGKALAGKAIEKLGENAAKEVIAKEIAKRAMTGATVGGASASTLMELQQIIPNQIEENKKISPGPALLGATVAGMLDWVPEWYLLKRMGVFGNETKELVDKSIKGIAKYAGMEGLKQVAMEAPTEAMQAVIENAAVPGTNLSSKKVWDDVINSFILGGLTGGVMGGGSAAAQGTVQKLQSSTAVPFEASPTAIPTDIGPIAEQGLTDTGNVAVETPVATQAATTGTPVGWSELIAKYKDIEASSPVESREPEVSQLQIGERIYPKDRAETGVSHAVVKNVSPDGTVIVAPVKTTMIQAMQEDSTDTAKALYNRVNTELETDKRHGKTRSIADIALELYSDPNVKAELTPEDVYAVIDAFEKKSGTQIEEGTPIQVTPEQLKVNYTLERPRMVTQGAQNLSINDITEAGLTSRDDIAAYLQQRESEGMNISSAVRHYDALWQKEDLTKPPVVSPKVDEMTVVGKEKPVTEEDIKLALARGVTTTKAKEGISGIAKTTQAYDGYVIAVPKLGKTEKEIELLKNKTIKALNKIVQNKKDSGEWKGSQKVVEISSDEGQIIYGIAGEYKPRIPKDTDAKKIMAIINKIKGDPNSLPALHKLLNDWVKYKLEQPATTAGKPRVFSNEAGETYFRPGGEKKTFALGIIHEIIDRKFKKGSTDLSTLAVILDVIDHDMQGKAMLDSFISGSYETVKPPAPKPKAKKQTGDIPTAVLYTTALRNDMSRGTGTKITGKTVEEIKKAVIGKKYKFKKGTETTMTEQAFDKIRKRMYAWAAEKTGEPAPTVAKETTVVSTKPVEKTMGNIPSKEEGWMQVTVKPMSKEKLLEMAETHFKKGTVLKGNGTIGDRLVHKNHLYIQLIPEKTVSKSNIVKELAQSKVEPKIKKVAKKPVAGVSGIAKYNMLKAEAKDLDISFKGMKMSDLEKAVADKKGKIVKTEGTVVEKPVVKKEPVKVTAEVKKALVRTVDMLPETHELINRKFLPTEVPMPIIAAIANYQGQGREPIYVRTDGNYVQLAILKAGTTPPSPSKSTVSEDAKKAIEREKINASKQKSKLRSDISKAYMEWKKSEPTKEQLDDFVKMAELNEITSGGRLMAYVQKVVKAGTENTAAETEAAGQGISGEIAQEMAALSSTSTEQALFGGEGAGLTMKGRMLTAEEVNAQLEAEGLGEITATEFDENGVPIATEPSLEVTPIPNITGLSASQIWNYMVSRIPKLVTATTDKALKTHLRKMQLIDPTRIDTRRTDWKASFISMMNMFGATKSHPLGKKYRNMIENYLVTLRQSGDLVANNPEVKKLYDQYVALGMTKDQATEAVWTIAAPYHYAKKNIDTFANDLPNPTIGRSTPLSDRVPLVTERWFPLGRFWNMRKERIIGGKYVTYYMRELTPELRYRYSLSTERIEQLRLLAEDPNSKVMNHMRPGMGDEMLLVPTQNGMIQIITKYGKEFMVVPMDSLHNNKELQDAMRDIDMKDQAYVDSMSLSVATVRDAVDFYNNRKIFDVTLEQIKSRLPGAEITNPRPSVFHVRFPNGFAFQIRNEAIQYYENIDGKWEKINGRWSIKDGGKFIMEISKSAESIKSLDKTLLHEIFHAVADVYLTKEEQTTLVNKFRVGNESLKDTWEAIADAYMRWTPGTDQKSIFGKIVSGARDLLFKLRNLFFDRKINSHDEMFAMIRDGRILSRPLELNIQGLKNPLMSNERLKLVQYEHGLPVVKKYRVIDQAREAKLAWANDPEVASNPKLSMLIREANDPALEGSIPYTLPLWRRLVDWFKEEEFLQKRGIEGRIPSRAEHYLSNPIWLGSRYPEWYRAVQVEKDRSHNRMNSVNKTMEDTSNFQSIREDRIEPIYPIIEHSTAYARKYYTEEELRNPAIIKQIYDEIGYKSTNYVLHDKAISAYLEIAREMKRMYARIIEHSERAMAKPYMHSLNGAEFAKLNEMYKLLISGKEPTNVKELLKNEKYKKVDANENTGKIVTSHPLWNAYKNLRKNLTSIREARSKINKADGYFSLKHTQGPFYVAVKRNYLDKNGNLQHEYIWTTGAETAGHMDQIASLLEKDKELKLENRDMSVIDITNKLKSQDEVFQLMMGPSSTPTDSTFFMAGDMNMMRIIDMASAELKNDGTISSEQADKLVNSAMIAISDLLKARGAGQSSIERQLLKYEKHQTVMGYQRDQWRKNINSYIYGFYGMQTKFDAAMQYMSILRDVKRNTPQLYEDISQYAADNLRNADKWDRRIGAIKGGIFYYALGGKILTAVMQMSQNFVTAIPRLAMEMSVTKNKEGMMAAERYFIKAMKDIATSKDNSPNISPKERAMLEYFSRRGDLMARFMQEINIAAATPKNKIMKRMFELLGWPMTYTEIFNRRSTALAYYRFLSKKGGLTEQEIYNKTEDFIDKTHWWYGPSNYPAVARGSNLAARAAQLTYTFRAFTHNYVLSLYYAFENNGGKAGLVYAAKSFMWLTLLAGAPALPWLSDFVEMVEKRTGVPISMQTREFVRESFGQPVEKFWTTGIAGTILGSDIAAAVRPAGLAWPFVDAFGESALGVFSGMAGKLDMAAQSASVGDWIRMTESLSPTMIENMIKSYRMSTRGITTAQGVPVRGPDLVPVKFESGDSVRQFFGFKPTEYSAIQKERFEEKIIAEAWNKRAQGLYKEQRLANDAESKSAVSRKMTEFNQSIPTDLYGVVPFAKWQPEMPLDKKMIRFWGNQGTAVPRPE